MELTTKARLRVLRFEDGGVEPGTEGTINYVGPVPGVGQQIGVKLDDNRTVVLVVGSDEFELI